MKPTITDVIDIIGENTWINCKTRDEARAFIKFIHSIGFGVESDIAGEIRLWIYQKENTHYSLRGNGKIQYAGVDYLKANAQYLQKRMSFQEFMDLINFALYFKIEVDPDEFEKILLGNYEEEELYEPNS
ncbi:hypothetical protein M2140_000092 [Clostridiales Family XIII bacterium PM5-7]